MRRLFSSDMHLGSNGPIDFDHRPFKTGEAMARAYVSTVKQQVKPGDTFIHVGDFVSFGKDRQWNAAKISGEQYTQMMGVKIILIKGNHDEHNHVRCDAKELLIDLGPYEDAVVCHFPSYMPENSLYTRSPKEPGVRICICGHVHGRWKTHYDSQRHVLNINVGVDMWNHHLVPEQKLIEEADKFFREHQ